MRKLKGENPWYKQKIEVPLGTCDLCGGIGRYKTTFKHKKEIIGQCWQCSGTGFVKIRLKYTGEQQPAFFTDAIYDMVNETEDSYVVIDRDKQLVQVPKHNFIKTDSKV